MPETASAWRPETARPTRHDAPFHPNDRTRDVDSGGRITCAGRSGAYPVGSSRPATVAFPLVVSVENELMPEVPTILPRTIVQHHQRRSPQSRACLPYRNVMKKQDFA